MDKTNNLTALGRSLSSYNLLSPDKINQLKSRLQVGQLVKGRVIDILPGGKLLFRLQGLNLIAKSAVMFTTGSTVFAYVSAISPKLVLKWARGKNENIRLKKGLKNLGIEGNRSNMLIAEAILDSDLPLNSELFNNIIESVSEKLDGNESKESIQQAIAQLTADSGIMETSVSASKEQQEAYSVLRIHNSLQFFAGQLALTNLQEDVNIRFIIKFISSWNSLTNIQDIREISTLLPQIGLRHEADIYKDMTNRAVKINGKERNLKSSLIGFRFRLITLLKRGYKISILNKLLSSTDNIIKEIDALALNDNKGFGIINLFPPVSSYDGGTLLWKRRLNAEYENEWSLKVEMNLEPLGHAEVDITMSSGNVGLKFNLQIEQSNDLVSENIKVLEKKLGKLELNLKEITIKRLKL